MTEQGHTLILLPWLKLESPVTVCKIGFASYKKDQVPAVFQPYGDDIARILASYCDIKGNPISQCILGYFQNGDACKNLTDAEVLRVNETAQLLAFCGLSRNEYFAQLGDYTNSTAFQVFFQRFSPGSELIALTIRRRDGETLSGGYKHGEIKFSIPVQCAHLELCRVDLPLLEAFNKCLDSPDAQVGRLVQAMSLYDQAHTDSDAVMSRREVILIASAFEQLFANCNGADDLACKVSSLLDNYGSIKVGTSARSSMIQFSKGREKQEGDWFIHRKWAQELYQMRNDFTHGNEIARRRWGWSITEHLVMASFMFPLLVKILLAESSNYILTKTDLNHMKAIDHLLDLTGWSEESEEDRNNTKWRELMLKHELNHALDDAFERAWNKLEGEHDRKKDDEEQ